MLSLFYEYIVFLYFNPACEDFGKRIISEYFDIQPLYSLYLLKKFAQTFLSVYDEMEDLHTQWLDQFVPESGATGSELPEMEEEEEPEPIQLNLPGQENMEEEELKDSDKPPILVNSRRVNPRYIS